jgi:hypothetical protein
MKHLITYYLMGSLNQQLKKGEINYVDRLLTTHKS